jgi:pyruvate/2-oxoglutarate dehydrogenase complex dihydrolipoamide acyltransferase (E2) component
MTLGDIVRRVQELTKSIRQGQVNVADLYGASITLTNIGPLKGIRGTPFVLPGQVGMVAVGALVTVPRYMDVGTGELELCPRRVVNLRLVFDHRPFNGTHAMSLLRSIRNHLAPMKLQEHLEK